MNIPASQTQGGMLLICGTLEAGGLSHQGKQGHWGNLSIPASDRRHAPVVVRPSRIAMVRPVLHKVVCRDRDTIKGKTNFKITFLYGVPFRLVFWVS